MNTLARKIKSLRDSKNMTVLALAKALGVSHVTVLNWERGETKNMKLESLVALSKFFKVPIDDLVNASKTVQADSKQEESATFDVLDVYAACGDGLINNEYPEIVRRIVMPLEKAIEIIGKSNKNGSIRVILASKDSMTPTINPNDLLFVDTSVTEFVGESVYILLHGGELLCKRLSLVGKYLTVISDNKNYAQWRWEDRPDETRIIGKVIRALPMDFKNFGN